MSIRLTIAKNGNAKVRTVAVVKKSDIENEIFKVAKNKLQVKKPSRLFDQNGHEIGSSSSSSSSSTLTLSEILRDDSVVIVSGGEDYVGVVKTNSVLSEEKVHMPQDVKFTLLCKESYVEEEAIQQMEYVVKNLDGVKVAAGMPDLHPGKTFPIGASFAIDKMIYPPLIGNDIGCGMALYETTIPPNSKSTKLANQLAHLESSWPGDQAKWLKDRNVEPTPFDSSLGTIGGGNHFSELQVIESIEDEEEFKKLSISPDSVYLLVHSGSRGFGGSVLKDHLDKFGNKGLSEDSDESIEYLKKHEHACSWARASRELIAYRTLVQLNSEGKKVLDVWHNNVIKKTFDNGQVYWLHRKGAAPSDEGPVVIPGSRGSYSYLVLPIGSHDNSAYSLAHGAGRKMNRGKAFAKMKDKYKYPSELEETPLGGCVICEDKELIFEEAPEAYKDVEEIIADLRDSGLIKVIAKFRPILTYKTRSDKE